MTTTTEYTDTFGNADNEPWAFADEQEIEQLSESLDKGTKVRLHYRAMQEDEPSVTEATVSRQPFGSVFAFTVEEGGEDGRPIDLREYNGTIKLTRIEPSLDRGLGHLLRIDVEPHYSK